MNAPSSPRVAPFRRGEGVCLWLHRPESRFDARVAVWEEAERYRTGYVVDLRLGESELFRRLHTNRKRQVRRSPTKPARLVTAEAELTEFFVRTYPDFMASRGAASVYALSSESLALLCASPQTILVGVEMDSEIVAAALFGFTSDLGDYLFSVSVPGAERHSATLVWEGMRALAERDVPKLNLGGGVTEDDGVAVFKQRFGPDEVPLRRLREIYDSDVYRASCLQVGRNPDSVDAYFPAYRAA